MSAHDDLRGQLRTVNPVAGPDHVSQGDLDRVLSVIEERRTGAKGAGPPVPRRVLPGQKRRLRPIMAFGGGLALVLASVGVTLVLVAGPDGTQVSTPTPNTEAPTVTAPPTTAAPSVVTPPGTPPETSTATTSLPEPMTADELAALLATLPTDFREGWTQPSPAESGLAKAHLERIFVVGGRLVGIGRDPRTGHGTVWSSDDGLHWIRTGDVFTETGSGTVPSGPFPPLRWNSVKVGGSGLVAIDKPESVGAEVWVGELSEWDLIWKMTAELSGPCCFVDMAASEDRFVVVSEQVDHEEGNPGVWTSADADTWDRVTLESLPFAGMTHALAFVEAGGPGFVGITFGGTIFVSIDGIEWLQSLDFAESHPDAVGESQVAIGHLPGYRRLCSSDENGRWRCNPRNPGVKSVAVLGGRYIAVSREGVALGLSEDGRTWVWLPPTPGTLFAADPIDVVAWGDQIIVLAGEVGGNTVWSWRP